MHRAKSVASPGVDLSNAKIGKLKIKVSPNVKVDKKTTAKKSSTARK